MNICAQCGTPTAPSWLHCPRCAAMLREEAEDDTSHPVHSDSPTVSTSRASADSGDSSKSKFGQRLGLILSLLILAVGLVLVSTNDVGVHDQLHSTRVALASDKAQLSDSQVSLRIVNSRLLGTIRQNASTQSSLLGQQTQLQGELQGVVDLLQRTPGTGTTVGAIAPVLGVGATLVFTSIQAPSSVSLTTIITGASPGRTYAIGWGICPEDLLSQQFAATAIATPSGFVILPTIHIDLPANGSEFWLRLHEITPLASTGVLGGLVDAYFRQGESLGNGSPVPPTRAAC